MFYLFRCFVYFYCILVVFLFFVLIFTNFGFILFKEYTYLCQITYLITFDIVYKNRTNGNLTITKYFFFYFNQHFLPLVPKFLIIFSLILDLITWVCINLFRLNRKISHERPRNEHSSFPKSVQNRVAPLSNRRSPSKSITIKSFSSGAVSRPDWDTALCSKRQRLVQIECDELVLDARRIIVVGFAKELVAVDVGCCWYGVCCYIARKVPACRWGLSCYGTANIQKITKY